MHTRKCTNISNDKRERVLLWPILTIKQEMHQIGTGQECVDELRRHKAVCVRVLVHDWECMMTAVITRYYLIQSQSRTGECIA